jgi:hypothetical protein
MPFYRTDCSYCGQQRMTWQSCIETSLPDCPGCGYKHPSRTTVDISVVLSGHKSDPRIEPPDIEHTLDAECSA